MKRLVGLLVATLLVSASVWAGGQGDAGADGTWAPSRNVDFIVTSSPGGGSDIFARLIADLVRREGFVGNPVVVSNRTDGVGEAARMQLTQLRGAMADHTIMAFNLDDMIQMVQNTPRRMDAFTPLAVMAVDKHLLYVARDGRYQSFQEVMNSIQAGNRIVAGGSRGSDTVAMELLMSQMGWTEAQMPYIMSLSSNDAIVSALGHHLDVVISKPAAAHPFVESGHLVPILALSDERFTGNLAGAPTLSEVGSTNLQFPLWRGIVGSPNMSPAARDFWSGVFAKVTETAEWQNDYIERFQLINVFMDYQESATYMTDSQREFISAFGAF